MYATAGKVPVSWFWDTCAHKEHGVEGALTGWVLSAAQALTGINNQLVPAQACANTSKLEVCSTAHPLLLADNPRVRFDFAVHNSRQTQPALGSRRCGPTHPGLDPTAGCAPVCCGKKRVPRGQERHASDGAQCGCTSTSQAAGCARGCCGRSHTAAQQLVCQPASTAAGW